MLASCCDPGGPGDCFRIGALLAHYSLQRWLDASYSNSLIPNIDRERDALS